MKFHPTVVLALAAVPAAANANLLRSSSESEVEQSSCNDLTSKDSCYAGVDGTSGASCAWCVAGAVPNECVSQDQASMLPEDVFECSTPSWFTSTFQFEEGLNHRLSIKESNIGQDEGFCDPDSKSISGYMDIKGSKYDENGQNKHLFFWMFEKRGDFDEDTPFIIWLTGGPGCSSTLALLTENGPCSVNKDGKTTTVNPYSWTETAHVLWLDQPAGVGFSYGEEDDSSEKMVAEDAYYFLQAFFQTYPEYQSNPFYVVGESYAGHYVPAIAHHVFEGNNQPPPNTVPINLAGISIGNGLVKPEEQYKYYPEMGHNNSHGIPIFDDTTYETMMAIVPKCTALIHACNQGDSMIDEFACQSAFMICNVGLTSPYQATGLNPYDIRIPCEKPPLCYDFDHVGSWLNLPSTKESLGVDPKHSHSWRSCNFGINAKFHSDWMHDFSQYVTVLLDAGIPALVYAGDVDFICNYMGNRAWTHELEWSGKAEYQAAPEHDWEGSGNARTSGGLTFLQVFDAGHMVPADQPKVALDMIANFVSGGEF
mmetsp:Transcript_14955/g.19575  ORF Transcript_14955/g.19575 Transcript_14955/m.19575 type:complete len:539 (+) Transcript_14955:226-1842(+)